MNADYKITQQTDPNLVPAATWETVIILSAAVRQS